MKKWGPLVVLGLAQFLMVLDQAVMNVSISQLVEDFDTTVTTIQAIITLYALVMATTMMTGGKIGDIIGRRRAFAIGLVIYGAGSALTAASWNVATLLLGWSILEGIGAALVLPALVALVAANYQGKDRVTAFGILGGVAGAGIAAGPIVGGYFTANLSWRWVFVGEVVIALIILIGLRLINDTPATHRPRLDIVGALLSALGLGMIVIAMLQAGSWGFLAPKNSPIEPFGFALTPFVIAAGFIVLWLFVRWERRREARAEDPLVKLDLLKIAPLRGGLGCFLSQNVILLGIFFILPLYLQIVLGFDALETGIRMLPISIAMFITSATGPRLTSRFGAKRVVQAGYVVLVIAAAAMLQTVQADLDNTSFAVALVVLGIGMGLIASQLGNVVQSAVETKDRGEAGGLQYTSQQLGSAIGTALIGAIVIGSLVNSFVDNISENPAIPGDLAGAIEIEVAAGANFVAADDVETALTEGGVGDEETDAVIDDYREAQLQSLKTGLLVAGFLALMSLPLTRTLPSDRSKGDDDDDDDDDGGDADELDVSSAAPAP